MKIEVIYEDNHLLAVNKPAGILVQGDRTGDVSLVDFAKEYIKEKYQKPGKVFLGLVHRLDRPVSGVVVMARTSKALTRMSDLFKRREVDKIYWALVSDSLPMEEGELVHWLRKDKQKNKVHLTSAGAKQAKEARLDFKLLSVRDGRRLVEVHPLTGRPHQIRAQLSAIGCPILGDLKYGHPHKSRDGSIALHARSLGFIHPVKKEALTLKASLPSTEGWNSFSDLV